MRTLLLDRSTWDLTIDAYGNIAVAGDPYSQAQDAASAIQLFLGELWYDTTLGIPYWTDILGQFPPLNYVRSKFTAAALTVPGVAQAQCFFITIEDRKLTGQVQITNESGQQQAAFFSSTPSSQTV